jgi:hypothetical protein
MVTISAVLRFYSHNLYFLEKFFKTPISLHFVTPALVSFLLSIIGSIYVMSHLAMEQKINQVSSKTADIV